MTNDPFAITADKKKSIKWNFSNPNNPDYREAITGDIVEIRQVQSKNHVTKEREWWPDGNAKLNMLFVLNCEKLGGEVPWIFSPKSVAAQAVKQAMTAAGIPANSWSNMAQMNVTIRTQDGVYASGHPRPWQVTINGPAESEFRGCFPYTGGNKQEFDQRQMQAQQQQMQQQGMQWAQQPAQFQPHPQQYQQPMPQPQQQPQFGNPQLQRAFNQASQAVHQSQFDIPQQQYQQPPMMNQNWKQDDFYSDGGLYDQEIPF